MKSKKVKMIILIAGELLIVGSLSFATFAWFVTSWEPPHDITLTSGESTVMVDLNAYTSEQARPLYESLASSGSGTSSESASSTDHLNPTPVAWNRVFDRNVPSSLQYYNAANDGSASSTEAISVTFDSSILSYWSYEDMYLYESKSNLYGYPALYIELDYLKDAMDGFVKVSLTDIVYSPSSPDGFASSLNYQYRYTTYTNLRSNPVKNGFAACAESLATTSFSMLAKGQEVSIYSKDDFTESASGRSIANAIENQCYVNAFPLTYQNTLNSVTYTAYHFSKATVLEIRPDPVSLLKSLKEYAENNGSLADYSFGLSFVLTFEFSNTTFVSVEGS